MNKLTTFFSVDFSDIHWKILKSYDFWFGYDRSVIHGSDKLVFIFGFLLVLAGLIALIFTLFAKNEFLVKVAKWKAKILVIIGLSEIVWFLFRYQNVQAFGTRFVAGLIAVIGLIWLYQPAKYFFTRYNTDLAEAERKVSRDKYLNMKTK